jgi:hypothetical protein
VTASNVTSHLYLPDGLKAEHKPLTQRARKPEPDGSGEITVYPLHDTHGITRLKTIPLWSQFISEKTSDWNVSCQLFNTKQNIREVSMDPVCYCENTLIKVGFLLPLRIWLASRARLLVSQDLPHLRFITVFKTAYNFPISWAGKFQSTTWHGSCTQKSLKRDKKNVYLKKLSNVLLKYV